MFDLLCHIKSIVDKAVIKYEMWLARKNLLPGERLVKLCQKHDIQNKTTVCFKICRCRDSMYVEHMSWHSPKLYNIYYISQYIYT